LNKIKLHFQLLYHPISLTRRVYCNTGLFLNPWNIYKLRNK
jgi:hypothetical protein